MEKGKHIDETIPDGHDIITPDELMAWLLSMAERAMAQGSRVHQAIQDLLEGKEDER